MNTNLLDLNTDILEIIGAYVKKNNSKREFIQINIYIYAMNEYIYKSFSDKFESYK